MNELTCMQRDSIELADIEAEFTAQLKELRQREVSRINRGFTGRKLYRPSDEQDWGEIEINDLASELTTELRKMKDAEKKHSLHTSDWMDLGAVTSLKPATSLKSNEAKLKIQRTPSVEELVVDDGILDGMKSPL